MAAFNFRYYTYIKPVVENKTVRSYSPFIFSLITTTILIVFAIKPTISTILNLQKDIENHKKILAQLNTKAQDLTQAKRNLASIDPQIRVKIETAIPNKAEVSTLVKSLQSALPRQASSSALQVQPVVLTQTSAQKIHPDLGQVSFTYNTEGSFLELVSVLSALSSSPRVIRIESVNLSKQSGGPTIMSINGKAYYLK